MLYMTSENLQNKIWFNFHLGSLQGGSVTEVSTRSHSEKAFLFPTYFQSVSDILKNDLACVIFK